MPKAARPSRDAKSGQYVTIGRTADGVAVLSSAAKPKHFTAKQISKTIEVVKRQEANKR